MREFQTTDDEILAATKARINNYPEVAIENSSEPGSMLLQPEKADGSIFDAQGQEFKNAMNFLEESNAIPLTSDKRKPTTPKNANDLLSTLDISARRLIDTQDRCRKGACQ